MKRVFDSRYSREPVVAWIDHFFLDRSSIRNIQAPWPWLISCFSESASPGIGSRTIRSRSTLEIPWIKFGKGWSNGPTPIRTDRYELLPVSWAIEPSFKTRPPSFRDVSNSFWIPNIFLFHFHPMFIDFLNVFAFAANSFFDICLYICIPFRWSDISRYSALRDRPFRFEKRKYIL